MRGSERECKRGWVHEAEARETRKMENMCTKRFVCGVMHSLPRGCFCFFIFPLHVHLHVHTLLSHCQKRFAHCHPHQGRSATAFAAAAAPPPIPSSPTTPAHFTSRDDLPCDRGEKLHLRDISPHKGIDECGKFKGMTKATTTLCKRQRKKGEGQREGGREEGMLKHLWNGLVISSAVTQAWTH